MFGRILVWFAVVLIVSTNVGSADEIPKASCWCELSRSGCPFQVAPWARCSLSRKDVGYYVGGGAVCSGECRYEDEGVWGHDYQMCRGKLPWDALRWHHSNKPQGGRGAYQSN
ncbi:MAG: hypothetical protein FJ267_08205 [Planctomycetes bacterium]|nr:hypothetical protein [Planctomycetota bacterium]